MGKPIMKLYLEKTTKELEILYTKYNILPKVFNLNKNFDKFCLSKTIKISSSREKNISTVSLESNLRIVRDVAIKNFDIYMN